MSEKSQLARYVAPAIDKTADLWREPEWERLWLSTLNRQWRSLALVPAGPGAGVSFAADIAMSLARTGMAHLSQQIHVADATEVSLTNNREFLAQIKIAMTTGPVIVALASCAENPITAPLARNSNVALLCTKLGAMKMQDASKTVEEIGRDHFIGAVTFE